ncbi:CPCC family cysteine-rich protein [Actinoplanes sp. M2I2]
MRPPREALAERGGFKICPVCSWEDDGRDDSDADEVMDGPGPD